MEVLTVRNRGDRHGRTSHLSQGELADLAAFLMELEPEPEVAGMVDPGPLRGGRPVLAAPRTCAGYLFTLGSGLALDLRGWRVAEGRLLQGPGPARYLWGAAAAPGVYTARLAWKGGAASMKVVVDAR